MKDLEGHLAIITGAARGTGAATARRFVEYGATVVIGDILHEQGEEVAAALGERAHYVPHDVTRADEWEQIVNKALEWGDRIDSLVNNAAALHLGALTNTPGGISPHPRGEYGGPLSRTASRGAHHAAAGQGIDRQRRLSGLPDRDERHFGLLHFQVGA